MPLIYYIFPISPYHARFFLFSYTLAYTTGRLVSPLAHLLFFVLYGVPVYVRMFLFG